MGSLDVQRLESYRALDSGPAKNRLGAFLATLEVGAQLGLPGSVYTAGGPGFSTAVPAGCTSAGCVIDYALHGGSFETIRTEGTGPRANPLGDILGGLASIAPIAAWPFLPALLPVAASSFLPRSESPTAINYRAALADVAPVAHSPSEVVPMGLFDSFDFGSSFDGGGGFDWSGLLNVGVEAASGFLGATQASYAPVYNAPMSYPMVQATPVAQDRSVAVRARSAGIPQWAVKFPTLWQFIATKGLGTGAIGSMLALLVKWGPTALTAMWGAGVVADLIQYKVTRKRRRMNPANSKALRRAARRIKGFHRMCGHIDLLKTRGRRHGGVSCGTCKRSPCRCR